jgi:hypothetical protein
MSEPTTNLEDAERERGALPMPVGPGPSVVESVDKLTALFAPVASLREDLHDSPLHRDYRLGRDLPESGGRP